MPLKMSYGMEFAGRLSRPWCVDKIHISVSKFSKLHSRHTTCVGKKSYINESKFSQSHNRQPVGGLYDPMCGLTFKFGIRY